MNQIHPDGLATTLERAITKSALRSKSRVPGATAIDLLAIVGATSAMVALATLFSGWPVLDRLMLLSAVSAAAAAPWLYSTMIAGTKHSIGVRLALFGAVLLAAFTANPEIVAVTFVIHSLAAIHAASGRRHQAERWLLLSWSGAAAALAVLSLTGLS